MFGTPSFKTLRRLSCAFVFASFCSTAPSFAADVPESSDPIKLALNEWTGQHITTFIAGEILQNMGYSVEYATAGYAPQFSGLMDGTLSATLEIWESSIGDAASSATDTGKVVDIGSLGLTPIEGWFYPDYVADACPGLPDWKALEKCAEIFATSDTFPKGRLVDYPADWESANDVRVEALALDFSIVPAGSEGSLIAELKAATTKKQPLLMMFWSPHWVHNVYPGNWVKLPAYEPACFEDPSWGENPSKVRDCGWASSWVKKFAWAGMADKWPAAFSLLKSFQLGNAEQEAMMKAVDVDGEDVKAVSKAWVENNADVWKPWVESAMAN